MGRRARVLTACFFSLLALAACGGDETSENGGGAKASGGGSPLATAKGSIEHQLGLLRAQKVDELKTCFTARLQERITAKIVADAQEQANSITMDELWASATEGEYQGKKTMKVKMKNGRTLTTLVLTDGKWLSDTIWFR